MAIRLVEEPAELYQEFRAYEGCFFKCGKTTKFWHNGTNKPVCKDCAKIHKTSELPKAHPQYKK